MPGRTGQGGWQPGCYRRRLGLGLFPGLAPVASWVTGGDAAGVGERALSERSEFYSGARESLMGRGAQPARWGPRTAQDVDSKDQPVRVGGTWVATRGAGQGSAAVWGGRYREV